MFFLLSFLFAFLQCVLTYNLTKFSERKIFKSAFLVFIVKFALYAGGVYLLIFKWLGYIVSILGGFLSGISIGFICCIIYRMFFCDNLYGLWLVIKGGYNSVVRFFKNAAYKRKMKKRRRQVK